LTKPEEAFILQEIVLKGIFMHLSLFADYRVSDSGDILNGRGFVSFWGFFFFFFRSIRLGH